MRSLDEKNQASREFPDEMLFPDEISIESGYSLCATVCQNLSDLVLIHYMYIVTRFL